MITLRSASAGVFVLAVSFFGVTEKALTAESEPPSAVIQDTGHSQPLMVKGELSRQMAIGAESTGWAIELDAEVTVGDKPIKSLAVDGPADELEKLNGKKVMATGELSFRHGVERGDWPVLKITDIHEASQALISGSVMYRERVALPPDAVIKVRLEDVSQQAKHDKMLAKVNVPADGNQVPIAFVLPYNSAEIVASHQYQVKAAIVAENKTLFRSKGYAVITNGAPSDVVIVVHQVRSK